MVVVVGVVVEDAARKTLQTSSGALLGEQADTYVCLVFLSGLYDRRRW